MAATPPFFIANQKSLGNYLTNSVFQCILIFVIGEAVRLDLQEGTKCAMNGREVGLAVFEKAPAGMFTNREHAVAAVNMIFDEIFDAVCRGDKVVITGFGRFDTSETKAREGKNPKTGTPVDIPGRRHVRFTASPGLRGKLNDE